MSEFKEEQEYLNMTSGHGIWKDHGMSRRFNHRVFKKDKIPSKELINKILQDSINFVPVKNEAYNFKLEAWGPEHEDEKKELAIATIAKRDFMFLPGMHSEESWYKKATELYDYEEENDGRPICGRRNSYFNNQVRAPYVISVVMQPNMWNPKNEPNAWPLLDSFMAGMFTYGVSIVANEYGIDCSFCSCFQKGLRKYSNLITTPHEEGFRSHRQRWQISNCLTLICLGYYDMYKRPKTVKHANGDLEQYKIIQDGGSWYDVKNKVKLKHKQTKPKVENICEWK